VRVNLSFSIPEWALNESAIERGAAELMLRLGVPIESVQISYSTDFGVPTKVTDITNEGSSDEHGEQSVGSD
jgi:hypothetical protein